MLVDEFLPFPPGHRQYTSRAGLTMFASHDAAAGVGCRRCRNHTDGLFAL